MASKTIKSLDPVEQAKMSVVRSDEGKLGSEDPAKPDPTKTDDTKDPTKEDPKQDDDAEKDPEPGKLPEEPAAAVELNPPPPKYKVLATGKAQAFGMKQVYKAGDILDGESFQPNIIESLKAQGIQLEQL